MRLNSWGRYPIVDSDVYYPLSLDECKNILKNNVLIPRGLGRSYGDSSLLNKTMETKYLNKYISFDEKNGQLECFSGVSFNQLIRDFLPRGWFLPVTPGSSFVTVGGAIASDVHGKNHHKSGSFSDYVQSINILLGNGELIEISRSNERELFLATCGGMGLTGVIISAKFSLIRVSSSIVKQKKIKTYDLDETIDVFEQHKNVEYSVAWIDCLAQGKNLGRSIVSLGEHSDSGSNEYNHKSKINIPFTMPSHMINYHSMKLFNNLYYNSNFKKVNSSEVSIDSFFYPLDSITNWNLLYGKSGFLQYQFVIPKSSGLSGLKSILEKIAGTKKGSILAVLKIFGKGNENFLSFPIDGYTLALDFKISSDIFDILNEFDQIMIKYGGRIYLTKDSRMSESVFKSTYNNWEKFEEVREKYFAIGKFASLQSIRLGLK